MVRWLLVHRSFNFLSVIGRHVTQSIYFLCISQKKLKKPPILLVLSCDTWWWVTAGYHGEKILKKFQACLMLGKALYRDLYWNGALSWVPLARAFIPIKP